MSSLSSNFSRSFNDHLLNKYFVFLFFFRFISKVIFILRIVNQCTRVILKHYSKSTLRPLKIEFGDRSRNPVSQHAFRYFISSSFKYKWYFISVDIQNERFFILVHKSVSFTVLVEINHKLDRLFPVNNLIFSC